MKRKKFRHKTCNLALMVAVALGCTVSPWQQAMAAETPETAEQLEFFMSADKEQTDSKLQLFQSRNLLSTVSDVSSPSNGFVIMGKDSADVTVEKYTGDSGVYVYTHDSANPADIYGGNITIVSAERDANYQPAVVKLRTDSSGINLSNDDTVMEVLNALAQKLTYKNYDQEYNLQGYAEIAEGLTQGSFVRKRGCINSYDENGKGLINYLYTLNKFTTVLTGDKKRDTEYKDYIQENPITVEPFSKVEYKLGGSTIRPEVTSVEAGGNFAAIMPANGKEFYVNTSLVSDQTLTLDLTNVKTNGGKVYGIYNDQAAAVRVRADGGFNIIGTTDDTYAGGIFAGNADGKGISTVRLDNFSYSFFNISGTGKDFAAIQAGKNGVINAETNINIVTDGGGYGIVAKDGGVVNLSRTDNYSIINANGNVALYAKDGGKISFLGAKEINGDAVAEGEGSSIDVKISGKWTGNAVGQVNAMLTYMSEPWKGNFDSNGNLSITTSSWEGNATRAGVNIQLLDKANWKGSMENGGNIMLMGRSNWVNTADKAITVARLTSSNVDGLRGSITSANDLTIDKFSGIAAVYFNHDTVDPTKIQGGNITVKAADKESAISLRTDSSGIDLNNDIVVKNVFNNMAKKLTYSAYTKNENNLKAYAEIAEGLTAGAYAQKIANINFDKTTGVGSVVNAGLNPFNTVITGDAIKDKVFVDRGVLKTAGNTSTYTFTEDAIINNTINVEGATPNPANMKYAVAVNPDDNKHIILDMNGNNLIIKNNIGQGQMAQSTSAIIYALNSDTSITINNPGTIDLSTYSQAYYAGGVCAGSRFAKDDKPCEVVINNDNSWEHAVKIRGVMGMGGVSSDSIFNVNWTSMKVFDHGHIDIKGLVDLDSFGAWCLSAIGSDGYINIGGGKIISRDYTSIDAYNNGTVNVNVSGSGNALKAGTNNLTVEGNLKATGQWVGAGSGGNINVAFINKDSYLAGLADNPAGGKINMFLQNGAQWINRDGGFRYGSGSSFNDDTPSLVNNFYGGDSETNRGIIIQKQKGKITLDKYQGHTLAYYEHDVAEPTKIIGGDLEINSAVKTGSENAVITMRTDNSGINVDDKDLVNKVLDNLAAKLSYTNYMTGERNLTGIAEISEGLTSSKLVRQQNIIFDEISGVGRVSKDPLGQIVTKFQTSITGDFVIDEEYRKAGTLIDGTYVFNKATVIELGNKSAQTEGYHAGIQTYTPQPGYNEQPKPSKKVVVEVKNGLKIDGTKVSPDNSRYDSGIYSGNGSELTINGNVDIELTHRNYRDAIGIFHFSQPWQPGKKAVTTINGNVTIDIKPTLFDTAVVKLINPRGENVVGIYNKEANGSVININGLLDLNIDGPGVVTDCVLDSSGQINLKGGRIITNSNKDVNNHALTAYSGTINLNMNNLKTLVAETSLVPGNTKVEVEGNILAIKNAETSAENYNLLDGTINMALTTGESYWKGVADNAGKNKLGTFNLYLQNGALWINEQQGKTYNSSDYQFISEEFKGTFDGVSHVTNFYGGNSAASRGIIKQSSDTGIAIDNYSGHAMVVYGHNSVKPSEIIGGGITIKNAAAGSEITLMTDTGGIDVNQDDTVKDVLNALAGKLTYTNYEKANGAMRTLAAIKGNLIGKVAIGEGLTAPGVLWKVGDIDFEKNAGTGSLQEGSVITPENTVIERGQYETMIMSGTKSAMVSSAMLWRAENTDMQKRLGDLRMTLDEGGIWANVYGGKSKYDQDNTNYRLNYKAIQLGYDKETNGGWRVGAAVSYNDGESKYILGGKGDNTATSLSLYGSWLGEKGHYTDIILKGGKIKNEFTVYNEIGHKVEGDYNTNGLSLSAEYGRRIEYGNGLYVEPQVQLSWGRLQGKDYTALSDVKDAVGNFRTMNISQDGFNSFVGRIGVGVGRTTEKNSIYAKAFLAREFSGDFSSSFIAEEAKNTSVDLGGSWAIFQFGGSTKLSNTSYAYANIEKSVGGDVDTKWRADAGMRWSF